MICIVETSFNSELDENIMASKHKRTFRKPKNAEEEKQLLENAVPKSTRSVNKWAMKIFSEWQSTRVNKKASEEPSSCMCRCVALNVIPFFFLVYFISFLFSGL